MSSTAASIDGQTTELTEDERVYRFSSGDITLKDVTELTVRPSGTHRVRTADGKLHIISAGWLAVSVTDTSRDGWTV